MGELNLNGWWDATRTDLVLSSGANHNLAAAEHMVLIPPEPGCTVTGFVPPDLTHTWLMTVSNGGAESLTFTNNDSGSTAGIRTMMPPGFVSYTLALGQTAEFVYTIALDPDFTGWYPIIPGTLNA